MRKFVKKIALLFMVCGLAVSVSSGAKIWEDEQEKIDEVMAQYEKTLKAYSAKRPTIEMCDKKSKSYSYDNETFCPTERFLNFIGFVKSYGGEYDGDEALKEAKRDKNANSKYGILKNITSVEHYISVNHKSLINDLKQDELRASVIRLNRTGL